MNDVMVRRKTLPVKNLMTTIYLVRHGAIVNPSRILYGSLPGYPLSEQGRRDALIIARTFKRTGVSPCVIAASPLERAQETAEIIARELGAGRAGTDDRLKEWNMGTWEGGLIKDFVKGSGYYASPMRTEGLEPLEDMAARMAAAVEDTRTKCPGGAAILVSHGEPIAAVIVNLKHLPWEGIHDLPRPLCSVWKLTFDGAAFISAEYAFDCRSG